MTGPDCTSVPGAASGRRELSAPALEALRRAGWAVLSVAENVPGSQTRRSLRSAQTSSASFLRSMRISASGSSVADDQREPGSSCSASHRSPLRTWQTLPGHWSGPDSARYSPEFGTPSRQLERGRQLANFPLFPGRALRLSAAEGLERQIARAEPLDVVPLLLELIEVALFVLDYLLEDLLGS